MTETGYFSEIEAHFAERRGTPFVLSAKDWMLMQEWQGAGVPLPVVIEAIDAVFEKNEASGRRKVISSLSYCRHAVKELWAERRELAVGEGAEGPEGDPMARLEALAAELESTSHASLRDFAERVRGLAPLRSVPRIEEALIELEREVLDAALGSMTAAERESLEGDVSRAVGQAPRMKEAIRARTLEANLRRALREHFQLPRLTLFR